MKYRIYYIYITLLLAIKSLKFFVLMIRTHIIECYPERLITEQLIEQLSTGYLLGFV